MLDTHHACAMSRQVVDIWCFPLEASPETLASLERSLSADERARAARFAFDSLRQSYICSRGVMRHLLGRYQYVAPASLCFEYGQHGKPLLAGEGAMQFNMSHAGDLGVLAITEGCEIGVDLEPIRPLEDMERIAGRFFCAEECAEILSLPPSDRERAFFLCWTRKEAYIKAVGQGLSLPLKDFRVAVLPEEPARFLHIGHSHARGEAWTLQDLSLAPGFAAAIAYQGQARSVTIFPSVPIADLLVQI